MKIRHPNNTSAVERKDRKKRGTQTTAQKADAAMAARYRTRSQS